MKIAKIMFNFFSLQEFYYQDISCLVTEGNTRQLAACSADWALTSNHWPPAFNTAALSGAVDVYVME